MLTTEDVRAIALFSSLPAAELDRLARVAADLHLGVDEFAVHEGGERALFAVFAGKIEVVKLIDGVERRLGWRLPSTRHFRCRRREVEPGQTRRIGGR